MPSANNLTAESRFMGLFIGPSGSGKTVAECSFPGPIKVLDFDGRIRGILGAPWIDKSQIEYDYYPPRISGDGKPTYERINQDLEALLVMVSTNKCPYKTIILDSITSQTFAMLCDAVPLTHKGDSGSKGKKIGTLNMAGPEDYGFEATATYNLMAFLRSLPLNILVSAHIIDRYGKADPNDKYSERVIVGEKLSIRDKIGENIQIYFDHVFRFSKSDNGLKYTVQFRGDLARTSFEKLPNGSIDITGKNFYKAMMEQVKIT